jgi:methylmalonyl-CoA epimerase
MLEDLSHIGIAVEDLDQALSFYRDMLGLKELEVKELPDRGIKVAILDSGNTRIELLEGIRPDSAISRFIQKRGAGIHHLCFEVKDIEKSLKELSSNGIRLIDKEARPGAEGKPVAFVHPASTHGVLLELEEL